jgi:hypothetical protein
MERTRWRCVPGASRADGESRSSRRADWRRRSPPELMGVRNAARHGRRANCLQPCSPAIAGAASLIKHIFADPADGSRVSCRPGCLSSSVAAASAERRVGGYLLDDGSSHASLLGHAAIIAATQDLPPAKAYSGRKRVEPSTHGHAIGSARPLILGWTVIQQSLRPREACAASTLSSLRSRLN